MARTIRVDSDVYAWLQRQARAFEDTPNSVLRRIAALDASPSRGNKAPGDVVGGRRAWQQVSSTATGATSTRKFNGSDRLQTVRAIEQFLGVNLSKIGSHRTFLEDETGTPYLVLGGYGDWHGIPPEIVGDARSKHPHGKLMLAKHEGVRIKVYAGSLDALLQRTDSLAFNQEGYCQFDLGWQDGRPFIKQALDVQLELLTEIAGR